MVVVYLGGEMYPTTVIMSNENTVVMTKGFQKVYRKSRMNKHVGLTTKSEYQLLHWPHC